MAQGIALKIDLELTQELGYGFLTVEFFSEGSFMQWKEH